MAEKRGLGRGLGALIDDGAPRVAAPVDAAKAPGALRVPLADVHKAAWQPRQAFEPDAMHDLVESVRAHGVLQPLLVRRRADGYELLAGERRWRAATAVGLPDVPVVVLEATDEEALALALIENLQREDLNPIEAAEGYRMLAERFTLTQEQIAERVGKARASVANALRLLALHPEVRAMVASGRLSTGHAKVLLGLEIPEEQRVLAQRAVQDGLSVRQLEALVDRARRAPRKPRAARSDLPETHVHQLCDRLHQRFGTAVRILPSRTYANGRKAKGAIEIDFYSNEDLDRLLPLLGLEEDDL